MTPRVESSLALLLNHDLQVQARDRSPELIRKTESTRNQFLQGAVTPRIRIRKPEVDAVAHAVLVRLKYAGFACVSARQIADDVRLCPAAESSPQVRIPVLRFVDSRVAAGKVAYGKLGEFVGQTQRTLYFRIPDRGEERSIDGREAGPQDWNASYIARFQCHRYDNSAFREDR